MNSQPSNPSAPNARTLRELRKFAFFAKGEFPDVGHRDGMHRQQAMKLPEAELWKQAAQKKTKSL